MTGRLQIVSGSEWRKQAQDEPPPLVDRLLPSRALAFIAGEPGIGKTWALWELALSVSSGHAFMGKYPIVTRGNVLVIASEGSRRSSEGRLWAVAKGKGLDPDQAIDALRFNWCEGFNMLTRSDVGEVATYIRENNVRLVLIDTLHGAWGGRENDSDAWGAVMQRGIRPLMAAGATVALVHHTAKAGDGTSARSAGQTMRGSSAMHGSRDCLLVLTRADENRIRVQVELRDDAPVRPFTFRTPDAGQHVGVGDSFALEWALADDTPAVRGSIDRSSAAVQAVRERQGGLTRDALAKTVGGRKSDTLQAIDALISRGEIVKTEPGARLWTPDAVPNGNADRNVAGTNGNALGVGRVPQFPTLKGGNGGTAPTVDSSEVY